MVGNIKEFNAGDLRLQIPETGIEATAQAARRAGAFYNQAAEGAQNLGQRLGGAIRDAGQVATDYLEHREKSHGAAALAGILDDKSKQWDQVAKTADPNDPTVASNFRDTVVEPALQEWRDSFITEGGQNWAENRIEAARQHFFAKTAADQSKLAGAAAINNLSTVVSRAANAVYRDPRDLDIQLKLVEDTIGTPGPTTTPEEHQKLMGPILRKAKEGVIQSYLRGIADRDPDEAEKIIDSGKYADFINSSEEKMFSNYIRAQRKRAESDDRAAAQEQRREKLQANEERVGEYIAELVDPNTGEIKLPKNFLARVYKNEDGKLTPSGIASVATAYNRVLEKGHAERDAPGLVHELIDKATRPVNDPERVTPEDIAREHIGKDLTWGSFRGIESLVKQKGLPETKAETNAITSTKRYFNTLFPRSDPVLGIVDPVQQEARNTFEQFFWPAYFNARSKGVPSADLLTPGRPEYLLKPEIVDKYKPTPTNIVDTIQQRSLPAKQAPSPNMPLPKPPVPFAPGNTLDIDVQTGRSFEERFNAGKPAKSLKDIAKDYFGVK